MGTLLGRGLGSLALLLAVSLAAIEVNADSNWPRWRGVIGNGHSLETGLPTQWSLKDCAWQIDLKGIGQSSPIIWGEKIFLTTALEDGAKRVVFCIDRNDGKLLWEQTVPWSGEAEKLHRMNSHATASCVTDGKIVIAFFGRAGMHCYSTDGKHLWSRDLGPFICPWGVAACPILVGDLVIQNCDADEDASIMALNKNTGETVWRTERPNNRGWSTPIVVDVDGRQEVVVNSHTGVRSYDPASGKELWYCKSFNGRGTPTVTPGEELLYTINGLRGDIYAIRPGGEGAVTNSHMAWHTPRGGGRDLPSPILIGKHLLVMNMAGVLTCYDGSDGRQMWQKRVGGNFSATPIAAGGLAYFLAESGETVIVKPGEDLEIVARNALGDDEAEIFRASQTPSEGQFFIRSNKKLYCIGQRKKSE